MDAEKWRETFVFWIPATILMGSMLAVGLDYVFNGAENFRWLVGVMTLAGVVLVYNAVTYEHK